MINPRILIIDDEAGFLDLVKEKLELEDYEVITALDGEEGIAKAKSIKPDLVICDIKMPKKDGFEVLEVLRHELHMKMPFIMLTVLEEFENVKKAYEDEADLYITKPVEFTRLMKNIKTLLNISKNRTK